MSFMGIGGTGAGNGKGKGNGHHAGRKNGNGGNGHAQPAPSVYTLHDLQGRTFPELQHVVGNLIVEGTTLLAARPKVGKTWFCLDAAIGVASGHECLGGYQCAEGDVLYLALEDNPRRMQRRADKLIGLGAWPRRLQVSHTWPRADEGGVDMIERWAQGVDRPLLVVIDVLQRFRRAMKGGKESYGTDYDAIGALTTLCGTYQGLAVIIVHHTRKSEAFDDPLDAISGTTGLGAAPDTELVIVKTKGGAGGGSSTSLYGRGRDVDELDKALSFDKEKCRWTILGDRDQVQSSSERRAVLDTLGAEMMKPTDLADELGRSAQSVRQMLRRLRKKGEVRRLKNGFYVVKGGLADQPDFA